MTPSTACRIAALSLFAAANNIGAQGPRDVKEPMTVIVGTIRLAMSGKPVANSEVYTDDARNVGIRSDSAGRFVMTTSRLASLLGARKDGYLEFQFPVLELKSDTLFADIELRTDPPRMTVNSTGRTILPLLCVIADATTRRLSVTNSCDGAPVPAGFTQHIIKHNPWSLYFGPAADRSGVWLRRR